MNKADLDQLRQLLREEGMVTKNDLKNFVTKDDLKNLVTKQDLKKGLDDLLAQIVDSTDSNKVDKVEFTVLEKRVEIIEKEVHIS